VRSGWQDHGAKSHSLVAVRTRSAIDNLRGLLEFKKDYPEAELRLIYRRFERLEIGGVVCIPCEQYLLGVVPDKPLP
jgi:hypothetical protein